MDDFRNFVAVGALLDDEYAELGVGFRESAGDDATC